MAAVWKDFYPQYLDKNSATGNNRAPNVVLESSR